jgi:hypothetical protein
MGSTQKALINQVAVEKIREWQTPGNLLRLGGIKNGFARLQSEGNLRVKRSDP